MFVSETPTNRWARLQLFLGLSTGRCRRCGLINSKAEMVRHPHYGWFCDEKERRFYSKWEDHRLFGPDSQTFSSPTWNQDAD